MTMMKHVFIVLALLALDGIADAQTIKLPYSTVQPTDNVLGVSIPGFNANWDYINTHLLNLPTGVVQSNAGVLTAAPLTSTQITVALGYTPVAPGSVPAPGSTSQILYNNAGVMAAAGGLTTSGTSLSVSGAVTFGSLGVGFVQSTPAGVLSSAPLTSAQISAALGYTPVAPGAPGMSGQMLYNNNGAVAAAAGVITNGNTLQVTAGLQLGTQTPSTGSYGIYDTSANPWQSNASTLTFSSLPTGFVQSTAGLLSSAALTSSQITTALGFTPLSGTLPGSTTQILYNNAGVLAAAGGLTTSGTSLAVSGTVTFSSMGAGVVQSSAGGLLSSAPLTSMQITTALGYTPPSTGVSASTLPPQPCMPGSLFQLSAYVPPNPPGSYSCDGGGTWRWLAGSLGWYNFEGAPTIRNADVITSTQGTGLNIYPGYGANPVVATTTGSFSMGPSPITITVASANGISVGNAVAGPGLSPILGVVSTIAGNVLTVSGNATATETNVPLQFIKSTYGISSSVEIFDSTTARDGNEALWLCCLTADNYSHNGYGMYLQVGNSAATGLNPNHVQFMHFGEYTQNGSQSYLTHIGFGLGKGTHGSYYPLSVNQTGAAACWDSNLDGTYTTGSTLSGPCKLSITAGQAQGTTNLLEIQNNAGVPQTVVDQNYNLKAAGSVTATQLTTLNGTFSHTLSSGLVGAMNLTNNTANSNMIFNVYPSNPAGLSSTNIHNGPDISNNSNFAMQIGGATAGLLIGSQGTGTPVTTLNIGENSSAHALTAINWQFAGATAATLTPIMFSMPAITTTGTATNAFGGPVTTTGITSSGTNANDFSGPIIMTLTTPPTPVSVPTGAIVSNYTFNDYVGAESGVNFTLTVNNPTTANPSGLYGATHTVNVAATNTQALGIPGTVPGGIYSLRGRVSLLAGSSGAVTYAGGISAQLTFSGTGQIGTAYGFVLSQFTSTNPITNAVGLATGPLSGINATNSTGVLLGTLTAPAGNFGIYQADSNPNVFNGQITMVNPTGNAFLTTNGTVGSQMGIVLMEGGTEKAQFVLSGSQTYLDYEASLNIRSSSGSGTAATFDAGGNAAFNGLISMNGAVGQREVLLFNENSAPVAQIGISGSQTYFDYEGPLNFRAGYGGPVRATLDQTGKFTAASLSTTANAGAWGHVFTTTSQAAITLQSIAPNIGTNLLVLPNGTSSASSFRSYNGSDINNSSLLILSANGNTASLFSGIAGTGTPITIENFGESGGAANNHLTIMNWMFNGIAKASLTPTLFTAPSLAASAMPTSCAGQAPGTLWSNGIAVNTCLATPGTVACVVGPAAGTGATCTVNLGSPTRFQILLVTGASGLGVNSNLATFNFSAGAFYDNSYICFVNGNNSGPDDSIFHEIYVNPSSATSAGFGISAPALQASTTYAFNVDCRY
jgi:hypothetical protein